MVGDADRAWLTHTYMPKQVFTPLEYGAIGYSEEDAISKFGEADIEVYGLNPPNLPHKRHA